MKRKSKSYSVVVEKCPDTGLYVGQVPGIPGVHSQGATLQELRENILDVLKQETDFLMDELISLYRRSRSIARRQNRLMDAYEALQKIKGAKTKPKE